jgi:hypothetical protein
LTARVSRNPRLALLMVVALAAALRWEGIGQLSLAQFDEGVFVSGAFGVRLHGPWHFPLAQPLQSPPLFPWMVAGAFWITGTTLPVMGIFLSAALGVATVAVYFGLLQRLYGCGFALAGSALLAASDLHVAFSRMSLTDVPLTFWFVVGAYCVAKLSAQGANHKPFAQKLRWGLAFGLATGAVWNTKYNGWMLLAIAATSLLVVACRESIRRSFGKQSDENAAHSFGGWHHVVALAVAVLVAILCFLPWYRFVEQTYPGGYGAVVRNHLRYTGNIAQWPGRAFRLATSLSAFRHFGWLATLFGTTVAVGGFFAARYFATRTTRPNQVLGLWPSAFVALTLLAAVAVLGADAVLFILAAVAIVPAMIWGRWPEVFFAVWAGAFLVLTPFYHPYTRLLVPAVPSVIALALWLLTRALSVYGLEVIPAKRGRGGERESGRIPKSPSLPVSPSPTPASSTGATRALRGFLSAGCTAAFLAALMWHPFGWLPNQQIWQRWSTHDSYRALGNAVEEIGLPKDAIVLCHGPPAMTLYIEREWTPLETTPFDLWLARVPHDRPCYLAVDFWGAYCENHQFVLASLLKHLQCLEPVAVITNDLNVATLLDYLPPAEVARQVADDWPAKHVQIDDHQVVFPADLNEPYANVIVLYRIDRECLADDPQP